MLLNRIKRKLIKIFFREQWSLLLCNQDGDILKHIIPPQDRIWADPFPVESGGKTYIFIEEQIGHGNGTVGFIELHSDLTYSSFVPILEKEYHLSFPNIFSFEKNGYITWYMIPETHENKTIDLYRAVDFPFHWEFETTLIDTVDASDTTLLFFNSYYWLFTSIRTGGVSKNQNLSIFYSDTFPSQKWIPHPGNPVCSSFENSRMAGAIFFNKNTGKLNRPSQNCLNDYGREANINEIIELTPLSYKEERISAIYPERDLHAVCTHTINYSDTYLLRDIKTRNLRFLSQISLKA
ncbi:hypothetical protein LQZ19_14615 [Treponema primitia]|uniref:glucosamine inositolphosphorylceramide transferase family protein n=1 Tax=Treponema primitia TaxID=88058 RepID=UPI00397EC790